MKSRPTNGTPQFEAPPGQRDLGRWASPPGCSPLGVPSKMHYDVRWHREWATVAIPSDWARSSCLLSRSRGVESCSQAVSSGFEREAMPIKTHDAQSFIRWNKCRIPGLGAGALGIDAQPGGSHIRLMYTQVVSGSSN